MSSKKDLDKMVKRLKGLKQYKDRPDSEILEVAKRNLLEKQVDLNNLATNPEEKEAVKNLLRKYLDEFELTTVSDIDDLTALLGLELNRRRLQEIINKSYKDDQAVPLESLEKTLDITRHISDLKKRLGLTKKEEKQVDPLRRLNQLKARFVKYVQEHRDLFTMKCDHCGGYNLIAKRILPDEVVRKIPFLKTTAKGIMVYNEQLMDLLAEGKITVKEASNVLMTSEDYIDHIFKEIYKKAKNARETD